MSLGSGPSPVCPRSLLSPDRLDIAIKWRFFRHLIDGGDPDSERVYRGHIFGRTGGREPGGSKCSIDDYVTACRDLLASMRSCGFDRRHPIPVGSNGRIRNGAHRLACALALDLNVCVDHVGKPGTASPWDASWLRSGGLTEDDITVARRDTEWLIAQR